MLGLSNGFAAALLLLASSRRKTLHGKNTVLTNPLDRVELFQYQ